ncbi:MAG: DUF1993 family protein [Pseudomonadota bacterium]
MQDPFAEATVASVRHYLDRVEHVLDRLSGEAEGARFLKIRLAPDMFDTGFNFALAIQFAARALCPPAGLEVPEITEDDSVAGLLRYRAEVADVIAGIRAGDLCQTVSHRAGEADLQQEPAEYVARFALPNMIFHLTLAYAGLRHGGLEIGKADFDGLHVY